MTQGLGPLLQKLLRFFAHRNLRHLAPVQLQHIDAALAVQKHQLKAVPLLTLPVPTVTSSALLFSTLEPLVLTVVSVAAGIFLLGEPFSVQILLAAVMIIVGIAGVQYFVRKTN